MSILFCEFLTLFSFFGVWRLAVGSWQLAAQNGRSGEEWAQSDKTTTLSYFEEQEICGPPGENERRGLLAQAWHVLALAALALGSPGWMRKKRTRRRTTKRRTPRKGWASPRPTPSALWRSLSPKMPSGSLPDVRPNPKFKIQLLGARATETREVSCGQRNALCVELPTLDLLVDHLASLGA